MNRDHHLKTALEREEPFDIIIIGGGATGVGAAVDAASRGHSVLLLEGVDLARALQAAVPNWFTVESAICRRVISPW